MYFLLLHYYEEENSTPISPLIFQWQNRWPLEVPFSFKIWVLYPSKCRRSLWNKAQKECWVENAGVGKGQINVHYPPIYQGDAIICSALEPCWANNINSNRHLLEQRELGQHQSCYCPCQQHGDTQEYTDTGVSISVACTFKCVGYWLPLSFPPLC